MAWNRERVLEDFPAATQQINGQRLVYLDSAASALKPNAVVDVIERFNRLEASNVHRGVHHLSAEATTRFERARTVAQRFLKAGDEREIIFTTGTTGAINLLAQSWGRKNLQPGDEVLLSEMEHHSNIVPWQMLASEIGVKVRFAAVTEAGELDREDFRRQLNNKTKLVSITHCSNTLGTINPIRELVEEAHRAGALVAVDGAQAATFLPLDVQELGCDFYAFSGHKVFGPYGIGVLYGRLDLLMDMPPYQGGGSMISEVRLDGVTFNEPPFRFEAGTPNISGVIGLAAALEYIEALDRQEIWAHEKELLQMATARLQEIEGLRLMGTAADKASILSFVIEGTHPADIGEILDQKGVAVRTGHHCTQPLMRRFQVPATVRASFSIYNQAEDIEKLVEGLCKAKELLL